MPIAIPIEVISALTALLAVVLSPIIQFYVTKKQYAATAITPNRRKWIDELRNQISELLSIIELAGIDVHSGNYFTKYVSISNKIKILINPEEKDHTDLLEVIDSFRDEMLKVRKLMPPDSEKLRMISDSIISQSQRVLKREWQRVKKGE